MSLSIATRQLSPTTINANITQYRGDSLYEKVIWGSQGAAIVDTVTGLPVLDSNGLPTYSTIPTDFTGYTGQGQIKDDQTSDVILATITVTLTSIGEIIMTASKDIMDLVPAGKLYFDVQLDDSLGFRHTFIAGNFINIQDVTR